MTVLSPETLLIAKNWDTVEEILKAKEKLESEFSQLLQSIEPELAKTDWWSDGWVFVNRNREQVYISKPAWKVEDTYVLWIGVEIFNPSAIFGVGQPAQLYVWSPQKHRPLAQRLVEKLAQKEELILGEIDNRSANTYVVRQEIRKWLPDAADTFGPETRQEIIDFFTHYARMFGPLEQLVQDYLSQQGHN